MASQETIEVNVVPRSTGKSESRKLRRSKHIPAVVYGPKMENLTLAVAELDAMRVSRHGFENTILAFKSDSKDLNGLKVLRKATTIHPVSRRPVHLDFYALDMTRVVRVHVEIRFDGKPIGAKEGGLLNIVRRDLEVECLPTEIPQFFSVDVSELGLNQSLHVSDITIPEGIKLITHGEEAICACAAPKEEAATPAPGTEAATAAPGAAGATAAPAAATPEKK